MAAVPGPGWAKYSPLPVQSLGNMKKRTVLPPALLLALLAAGLPASPEQSGTGSVIIECAWARELPPVSENGAAYVTIVNGGDRPDRLTSASSPIAERVEIHIHEDAGGVMAMRRLDGLDLPPGERVHFAPGRMHLMLIGLEQPLEKGRRFTIRLEFALAPPVEIGVPVETEGCRARA